MPLRNLRLTLNFIGDDSYRQNNYTKIYDARNGQQGKVKLWSDPLFWGSRAIFRLGPPAQLQIQDVRPTDEAVYRCRIDFRNSPTRNMKVNFTVIRKS
ncbi:hypothetical protein PV327_000989 [Microctonus hyperodae]|uniref:Ig-like domain-containing protein n=1 Tax=Microctonus hyperodae TaxID=165561 RepID=A0AA39G7D1_MICHY|nr:hypothetical protein PV327_000989 [Microctonus hyperodae]